MGVGVKHKLCLLFCWNVRVALVKRKKDKKRKIRKRYKKRTIDKSESHFHSYYLPMLLKRLFPYRFLMFSILHSLRLCLWQFEVSLLHCINEWFILAFTFSHLRQHTSLFMRSISYILIWVWIQNTSRIFSLNFKFHHFCLNENVIAKTIRTFFECFFLVSHHLKLFV